MDAKTIVLYVIIVLILWWCFKSEWQDISCSGGEENVCGLGKGRAYYYAHPTKDDTKRELLDKLVKTARYDLTTVHWRRVMLVVIVATLAAFLVAGESWPSPRALAIHMLVGFLAGYAFQIHYQTSVVRPALAQVDEIVRLLKK